MKIGLFKKVRILAFFLIIGIGFGIGFVVWPKQKHISYSQVQHEMLLNSENVESKVVLPHSIKSWNAQSLKVLNGWIKGMTQKEAQYFINNLHDIIQEAHLDANADINSTVNTYKQMYLTNITASKKDESQKIFKLIFVMIGIVAIVAILVLLCVYSIVVDVKTIAANVIDIDQIGSSIIQESEIDV